MNDIDHINGNTQDNRLINLREVSHSENVKNARRRNDNTSGVSGVHWEKRRNKWRAYIKVANRRKYLGYFENFTDAVAARRAAEKLYNFHPNHGRAA